MSLEELLVRTREARARAEHTVQASRRLVAAVEEAERTRRARPSPETERPPPRSKPPGGDR